MAEETFRLPDLGEGLTDAQLVSWRVQEGSTVEVNAPLCEVETAKAVVVIPSPLRGTVRSLHAKPGESVAVGAPLVTITASSDAPADTERTLVGYGPGGPESGVRRRARSAPAAAADNAGDVRAAPFVRQLAREKGVDLATVTGTGPGGRITRADVEGAAVGEGSVSAPASASAAADGDQRISVVGIRKAIARQMVRSVSTIPQFTEFAIFDATRLLAARAKAKASGRPLTPLPYFVAAVVRAVREYPLLNSSWDDTTDEIVVKRTRQHQERAAGPRAQGCRLAGSAADRRARHPADRRRSRRLARPRRDERRHHHRHQRGSQRTGRDRHPDHQPA
ncbi:MAG: hypothetical protein E6I22_02915 [Chloroflexi bacterium]|nr:MAG: hypothetical protein E6I22_02915 [Chloroflexota bacterium]